MIQREIILANISDAREQLEAIEKSLLDPEYEEIEFKLDLEHAYHHLNYSWNARNATDQELSEHSQTSFQKWSKFPVGELDEYK